MFSISCAWNSRRHNNAYDMIQEIKELGINKIELNFALSKDFVYDIISMKDKGRIEVTSLHNFCPVPDGVPLKKASPDYYSLASLDEDEREKAVAATKETISNAQRLSAGAVVLHMGKVTIKDRIKELAAALGNPVDYKKIKQLMIKEREVHSKPHLDKTMESLEELLKFAKEVDIVLGIETRYYHNEIPGKDELGIIFERFKDNHIGYWHDVGHAQLYENLGLCKHKDYLDSYKNRLIGIHVHDIKGIDDHLAPLQGEFDFSLLKPYLTKKTYMVFEPHYPATAEDIKKGIKHLENIFAEDINQ